MDCPLVAMVGTVEIVGPVELAPHDTTYEYVIIRDSGDELRAFSGVCATPGVSQLVELHTTALFVFRHTREECRLWCVVCEDGRQAMDFGLLRTRA
jgi:hypothetical protein